jgi:hypothetical protein
VVSQYRSRVAPWGLLFVVCVGSCRPSVQGVSARRYFQVPGTQAQEVFGVLAQSTARRS